MQTKTKEQVKVEPKVSFGNKKLPKSTGIFNIPAVVTCPFRTEFCTKSCYALKAERIYPAVRPAREFNLELSRTDNFPSLMIEKLTKIQHKIDTFRIHESGDFYNQKYLNNWFLIASEFPSIKFYAYTKSFFLDFSDKPSNFVLIASFDKTTPQARRDMYESKKAAFNNTFSIVSKDEQASCPGDCSKCSKCWTKTKQNITVNQH